MGSELIDNTFKTITQLQMQKNEIQNKNEDLSKKIVMMQEIYA